MDNLLTKDGLKFLLNNIKKIITRNFVYIITQEKWIQKDDAFSTIIKHDLNSEFVNVSFSNDEGKKIYTAYKALDNNNIEIYSTKNIIIKVLIDKGENS